MKFQRFHQTVIITSTVILLFLIASGIIPTTDYIAWFVEGLISVLAGLLVVFAIMMIIVISNMRQNFNQLNTTQPYHWGFIVWIIMYYIIVLTIAWTSQWYYIFTAFTFMASVALPFTIYYNRLHWKRLRHQKFMNSVHH